MTTEVVHEKPRMGRRGTSIQSSVGGAESATPPGWMDSSSATDSHPVHTIDAMLNV